MTTTTRPAGTDVEAGDTAADVEAVLLWLQECRDDLASAITAGTYERRPDLEERYGSAGREKCFEDACYLLDHLGPAVRAENPSLFVEYIAWAKTLLISIGVGADDLALNLEIVRSVLSERAPAEAVAALVGPVEAAIAGFDELPSTTISYLDADAPCAGIARRYLDAILAKDRRGALSVVTTAAAEGVPVRDLYLHVFAPVQREIGRLWQANEVTVATEHYCTAVTQLAISQLYPYIFSADRVGRTVVGTCVSGDLHEIGVRMVTDFFELEGWDSHYLGANTPHASVIQSVVDTGADLVAISATITKHTTHVAQLIDALRADERTRAVPVVVGGYPFNADPELWRKVGADGCAIDAEHAIEVGVALVEGQP